MASAKELRDRGIAAYHSGNATEGRRLLEQSVELDEGDPQTWLWLAFVSPGRAAKVDALRQVAAINPAHPSLDRALQHFRLTRDDIR